MDRIVTATIRLNASPSSDIRQSQKLHKLCICRRNSPKPQAPSIPVSNLTAENCHQPQTCTICDKVLPNLSELLKHLGEHSAFRLNNDHYSDAIKCEMLKLSVHPGDTPQHCDLRLRNDFDLATIRVLHIYIMQGMQNWIVKIASAPLALAFAEQIQLRLSPSCIRPLPTCTIVVQTQNADGHIYIEWHRLSACCLLMSTKTHKIQLTQFQINKSIYDKMKMAKGAILRTYFKTIDNKISPLNPKNFTAFFNLASQLSRIEDQLEIEPYYINGIHIKKLPCSGVFEINLPRDVMRSGQPCKLNIHDWIVVKYGVYGESKKCSITDVTTSGRIRFKANSGKHSKAKIRSDDFDPKLRYNITFVRDQYMHNLEMYALRRLDERHLVPLLFHEKANNTIATTTMNLPWFHSDLNELQQQAVQHIVQGTAYPAPYILFGPPGTGKTKTLCEAILQLWKKNTSNRILVCGSSNAAADELALRLMHKLSAGCRFVHIVYRLYATSWSRVEPTDGMRKFRDGVSNKRLNFEFPGWEHLDQFPIVVCTLSTAGSLMLHKYVTSTTFSHVIVDECGSATELQTLLPIAVCMDLQRIAAHVVLAGDPKQLGPVITSANAKALCNGTYGVSMLERLTNTKMYSIQSNGQHNRNVITQLVQNYRSNEHIVNVPSVAFYNGMLRACGPPERTDRFVKWSLLPNADIPIIFHAVSGSAENENESTSLHNPVELKLIMFYVMRLLSRAPKGVSNDIVLNTPANLQPRDIGIISPYALQCEKIREELQRFNWGDIHVAPVEKYQGCERPIILTSTVRSRTKTLGFLGCAKRLNVMMTRPQCLLIMIGDPQTLMMDQHWRKVLRRFKEMHVCVGEDFVVPDETANRKAGGGWGSGIHRSVSNGRKVESKPLPPDHPLQEKQIEQYLRLMQKVQSAKKIVDNRVKTLQPPRADVRDKTKTTSNSSSSKMASISGGQRGRVAAKAAVQNANGEWNAKWADSGSSQDPISIQFRSAAKQTGLIDSVLTDRLKALCIFEKKTPKSTDSLDSDEFPDSILDSMTTTSTDDEAQPFLDTLTQCSQCDEKYWDETVPIDPSNFSITFPDYNGRKLVMKCPSIRRPEQVQADNEDDEAFADALEKIVE